MADNGGDESLSGLASDGSANARTRYNQMLPGDWTHLGRGDLARVNTALRQQLKDTEADPLAIEATLMLCAILSTGRTLVELANLDVRWVETRTQDVLKTPPCLLNLDEAWGWWLPSGGVDRADVKDASDMLRVMDKVWIPMTPLTSQALERHLSGCSDRASRAGFRLFRHSTDQLRRSILALLDSGASASNRQRRSARTVESAERWLFRELIHAPGGDPAVASILTGRSHSVARPMTHYGSKMMDRAVKLHGRAVRPFDAHQDYCPPGLAGRFVGDPATPKDETVRKFVSAMQFDLRWRRADLCLHHRVFTAYTVCFLAFALGHRGALRMPSLRAIDANGFAEIADKRTKGPVDHRRVWVSDMARQQLAAYESHLDALEFELSAESASHLRAMREISGDGLAVFRLTKGLKVFSTKVSSVIEGAGRLGGRGSKNAGRHWLRGKMSGKCSSETLGAFFGHIQSGTDPWGGTSALDPLLFRADVARVIDPALERVGWGVVNGLKPAA